MIQNHLFKNTWSLQEIALPTNIKRIGTRSFTNSTCLVKLDLSNCEQLVEIGFDSFVSARSLQEIIFSPNLKEILAGAFLDCTSLTGIDLSNCIQFDKFGNNIFTNAYSLQEIIFPSTLQIYYSSFIPQLHKSC
jgi:hypothetical protein